MKTMKDYHNLYLKWDVLLLADFFEKFRSNCLENYGSRPSHYLSAPALSWDAMLNITKVELELILDLLVNFKIYKTIFVNYVCMYVYI